MKQRVSIFHRVSATVALAAAILFVVPAAHAANRQWSDPTSKDSITSKRDRLPSSSAPSLAVAPEARSLSNASGLGSTGNAPAAGGNTLVFTVDGSATITDSQGNTTTVANYPGGRINEAHIRVTGDGAPNDLYLLIYNFDEGGHSYLDPEVNYAYFDDFNSSRNLQANIGDLDGYLARGLSLELQLGFYNENNDTFTLLATATSPLSELVGYTYEGSSLAPPSQAWTPDFIAAPGVPEPASGALALLGALALFRRRRPRN